MEGEEEKEKKKRKDCTPVHDSIRPNDFYYGELRYCKPEPNYLGLC